MRHKEGDVGSGHIMFCFASHGKCFRFCSLCNGKPLGSFKQGINRFDIIFRGLFYLSKENSLWEVVAENHGEWGRGFCNEPNGFQSYDELMAEPGVNNQVSTNNNWIQDH